MSFDAEKQKVTYSPAGQAMPARVMPVPAEAFDDQSAHSAIYWLSGAGILMNLRGTVLLVDPLLTEYDLPLLVRCPLSAEQIPRLDAILITHIDGDHYSPSTCQALLPLHPACHSTVYVAQEMQKEGIPGTGHAIGDSFSLKGTEITLTPTKHNWQNDVPDFQYREWKEEEYCGYWFDTPDGSVWLPGDSRLLESHLQMPSPKVILFDFSDNEYHITLEGAIRLANAYPNAELLCIHWGTVDASEMTPFNGDPTVLSERIINPDRIHILYPGEVYDFGGDGTH